MPAAKNGAPIFIDYAHKPDALKKALEALRPYAKGRLVVVFGAGGDRDTGKRPLMGRIAVDNADRVIVTDDNPRSEQPAAIRAAILAEAKGAPRSATAREAIREAIADLKSGDVLLIAGKGHETGQIVGGKILPFSDHDAVAAALRGEVAMSAALDRRRHGRRRCARTSARRAAGRAAGPVHRHPQPHQGRGLLRHHGRHRDGHDFVDAALKAGAGLAVVQRAQASRFAGAPLLIVEDVLDALRDLAAAARARASAKVIAVTGSVGKTGTKEALRLALSPDGETHVSAASYNNHWGVPLSLARCPQSAKYAVFEIGMNHAGEIAPLTKLVRPHVAIVTAIEPVHLEFFGSLEKIADAKAEIFAGRRAGRRRGAQPRQRAICPARGRRQGGGRYAHRLVRRTRQGRRAAVAGLAASR